MADVYVNALTQIASEPTSTDSLVLVNRNTNEGKIIDYNKLADVILAKLASKQFSSLTTASKLLPGAINELDADTASMASSISQLNSRLTQIGNLYRFQVTPGSVATDALIPMTKDYTADDDIYVSNNAIHFAKSGTVRVAVHITGQATGTIKRMWAKIMGGNYVAHSISYGDYGTLELTAEFAVTTDTAITLIALSDMVVNGGSTAYSMVCVHWLG